MAYTNLSQLQNAQALNLSIGNFTDATAATDTLVTTTQSSIGNFWFTMAIVVIFLFLVYMLYRPDKNIQLDLSRSVLISSGVCFFVSTGFLLGGLITTLDPVIWFSSLIFIFGLITARLQSRGA